MIEVASVVLPLIPLALWCALYWWSPGGFEGEPLLVVRISLLTRVKMLSVPIGLGLAVLIFLIFVGRVGPGMTLIVLMVMAAALSVQVTYQLSTDGIRMARGRFRRWTEFSGVRRSSSGALLQGGPRSPSYPIFLSGNRDDDDFVLLLRTLVRNSYKGKPLAADGFALGDS